MTDILVLSTYSLGYKPSTLLRRSIPFYNEDLLNQIDPVNSQQTPFPPLYYHVTSRKNTLSNQSSLLKKSSRHSCGKSLLRAHTATDSNSTLEPTPPAMPKSSAMIQSSPRRGAINFDACA
jgi:hypothetical protein